MWNMPSSNQKYINTNLVFLMIYYSSLFTRARRVWDFRTRTRPDPGLSLPDGSTVHRSGCLNLFWFILVFGPRLLVSSFVDSFGFIVVWFYKKNMRGTKLTVCREWPWLSTTVVMVISSREPPLSWFQPKKQKSLLMEIFSNVIRGFEMFLYLIYIKNN